jgi:flagellar biosynthesis protein FliQ
MSDTDYLIIDEPNARFSGKLVINPIFILLASIIIPMIITLPFYGRFWLPFLWLAFNGFAMGSPSLKKEGLYGVLVCSLIAGIFYSTNNALPTVVDNPQDFYPYIRILLNAVLFSGLYMVVFLQSVPFGIFEYVKEQRGHN